MKNQKGFTLIELLVVIAILGILAAIVVPNVIRYMGSGNLAAANVEAHMVQNAVYSYMADNKGAIPVSTNDTQQFYSGALKGSYTIDDKTGVINCTSYPNLPSEYEFINGQWGIPTTPTSTP